VSEGVALFSQIRKPTEGEETKEMTRQYEIAKEEVEKAWKKVKENKGAPGIDGQTIEEFEERLEGNLYKIWNRMTSGSYFPPAVKMVGIPKKAGGERMLGIPTVSDRVAQQVTKQILEPKVEPIFHEDSYGYRPNKSQHDAIAKTKQRCWECDWVLEVDIKGYFDTIDHELMMKVLKEHTEEKWIHLYVERWLKAELQNKDGETRSRDKGSPQGSVISPLLSNIFLHHAFDAWMTEEYPSIPFERFADDVVLHCKSRKQAEYIKEKLTKRLKDWKLEIHPEKTRIVYCKDDNRKGKYKPVKFTFLGYDFKPRRAVNRNTGIAFTSFGPAISHEAKCSIFEKIREWNLNRRTQGTLDDISKEVNGQIRGWLNYYGKFQKSALNPIADHIDFRLTNWAKRKYKRLKKSKEKARMWLIGIRSRQPRLFAHWKWKLEPS